MRRAGVALVAALLAGTSAWAQTVEPASVRQSVDANGVDLFLGTLNVTRQDLSMGNAQSGMSYSRIWRDGAWVDNYDIHIVTGSGTVTITVGGAAEQFSSGGGGFTNMTGGGSSLSQSGTTYTYTTAAGTVYQFDTNQRYATLGADAGRVSSITYPNGMVLTFAYSLYTLCNAAHDQGCYTPKTSRLSSITSNLGYALSFGFGSNDPYSGSFYTVTGATLTNLGNNVSRSASYTGQTSATDMAGRQSNYQLSGSELTDIQRPGRGYDIHIDYDGGGRVSGYRNAANITTAYSYSDNTSTNERTTTITVGTNAASHAVFDIPSQLMKRSVDENGLTTTYDHDSYGRLTRVTAPQGNWVSYTYDTRGNVTQTTAHPKSYDTAHAEINTYTGYEAGCSNPKTCNQPNWTRDARGNQTDYTYDGGTGLISTINRPAYTDQSNNSVRPYMVYDYTTVSSPWGGSIALLAGTRTCQSGGWGCGGANVVGSAYYYNGSSGNFLLQKVDTGARDGSLVSEVAYGYDDVRNVATVTDPNGNLTLTQYDAARRVYWRVAADPDGNGWQRGKMIVTNYNADGTIQSAQFGAGNPDGGGFYEYYHINYDYDGAGRTAAEALVRGSTTFTKAQYSYDPMGRLDCTAVRMNSSVYGSLPDACTLSTQGGDGPDRIAKTEYDPASRVTRTWAGYGTAQQVHVDQDWTNNGKLWHVYGATAASNVQGPATSYAYDGFDRLQYTCFNTTSCTGSDYEQYDYDADSNQTWRRLRDGNVTTIAYDALSRPVTVTPPGYTYRDRVTSYAYDNLGHVLGVSLPDTGLGNMSVSFAYDAIGRLTHEQQPFSSVDYGYDAAGNRTYVGYGDGFWVNYTYDAANRMTQVTEKGQTVLVAYGYDELGRVQDIDRANGTHVFYDHGGTPFLNAMTLDLAGSASDLTTSYAYNAAGQITLKQSSNEAYAWAQGYNVSRGYQVNNLDQYTQSGSTTLGYDARGNLTSAPTPNTGGNGDTSGSVNYYYTADGQMIQAITGGQYKSFNFDGVGRLSLADAENRRFGYAGTQAIHELDASNTPQAHYVYGADEAPLVRYDGSYQNRHWLYTDERGSVIAEADDQGNKTQIDTYDEFGIPGSANVGRFGYTGQMWLPSINLWHYKARTYSPTLGRFLQTDPIGYNDGLNWYNYVGGDPVNMVDPTGLAFTVGQATSTTLPGFTGKLSVSDDYRDPANDPAAVITAAAPATSAAPQPGEVVVTGNRIVTDPVDQGELGGPTGAFQIADAGSGSSLGQQDKKLTNCIRNGRTLSCGANAKTNIKAQNCQAQAFGNNAASLTLDIAGGVLAFAAPEAKAAAGAVGVGGVTVAGLADDLLGLGVGTSGLITLGLDGQASKVANTIVKGLGYITGAGAVINDVRNIAAEYNKCMKE